MNANRTPTLTRKLWEEPQTLLEIFHKSFKSNTLAKSPWSVKPEGFNYKDQQAELEIIATEEVNGIEIRDKRTVTVLRFPIKPKVLADAIGKHLKFHKSTFENLHLQCWDEERQLWCQVISINTDHNTVHLSSGWVSFTRNLNEVELRHRETP